MSFYITLPMLSKDNDEQFEVGSGTPTIITFLFDGELLFALGGIKSPGALFGEERQEVRLSIENYLVADAYLDEVERSLESQGGEYTVYTTSNPLGFDEEEQHVYLSKIQPSSDVYERPVIELKEVSLVFDGHGLWVEANYDLGEKSYSLVTPSKSSEFMQKLI